jgi:hypothetical protein
MIRSLLVCLLFCLTPVLASLAQATTWSHSDVMKSVASEAARQGVSPALAMAVAQVESNFNPRVISHAGARGVMQIMPATAEGELGIPAHRLFDPQVNIAGGIRFLKHLITVYDGRVDIALSHYNGGSGVRRADGSLQVLSFTRDYVTKVLTQARDYRSHPYVLAARDPDLARRLADLDDFGDGDPLASTRAAGTSPVSLAGIAQNAPAPVGYLAHLDDKRARLVSQLHDLIERNRLRALRGGN